MEEGSSASNAPGRGSVALLPDSVARRIAAGEVIERPASVVRELLDNAVDAGAQSITVSITGGGSEGISVDDDGFGMSREDLELCWQPHATSKIRSTEDLDRCRTLGFRGEALASIAAVSRLEIRSRRPGAEEGYRLRVRQNRRESLAPAATSPGTTVSVEGLFYNLPARKRFLKRPQTETQQVRRTVLEKAFPEPGIKFRLLTDGKERLLLPAGSLEERAAALFGGKIPAAEIHRIEGTGEGFKATILVADPSHVRRDRKQIHPFVNGRRLKEFALVQAVEYAFTDVMHGGLFPYAALLVEVEPELVDFNIHPAKQEARFRNLQEIHHRIVETIRSFLAKYERKRLAPYREQELSGLPETGVSDGRFEGHEGDRGGGGTSSRAPRHYSPQPRGSGDDAAGGHREYRDALGGHRGIPFDLREIERRISAERTSSYTPGTGAGLSEGNTERRGNDTEAPESAGGDLGGHETGRREPAAGGTDRREEIRYFGQLFNLFLLVSRGKTLYIIDQHASHERLLYDALRRDRAIQKLLVPIDFEANEDESRALRRRLEGYRKIGITLGETGDGHWQITALPNSFREESESLVETILELRGLSEELDRRFTAELACKAAVKRGDILDEISGEELAKRVLALEQPRCPHGRPLYFALTEDELLQLIGRTH